MIGKDITKFAVPVHFNEPLSMLQKQAEVLEYHDILTKAYNC
jgi:predicted amidohydrolase